MAAGTLPAPGTKHGPCLLTCRHIDCGVTRAMMAATCRDCGKPILADVRFYQVDDSPPTPEDRQRSSQWDGRLAHAECVEAAYE